MQNKAYGGQTVPHFTLRKLSIGVVSVLLGTTVMVASNNSTAQASDNTDDTQITGGGQSWLN